MLHLSPCPNVFFLNFLCISMQMLRFLSDGVFVAFLDANFPWPNWEERQSNYYCILPIRKITFHKENGCFPS